VSIKAVTFDFWDTLFPRLGRDGGTDVAEARSEAIRSYLVKLGMSFSLERCREAHEVANRGHLQHWHTGMFQPTVDEALDAICGELGCELTHEQRAELALALQLRDAVTDTGPFAGVAELMPGLAERFRLGIISDTWLTPGEVPRLLLNKHGLLELFGAFVFSDETGLLKPHERQFRVACEALNVRPDEAIHVGDSERRDVVGARQFGMRAVLLDWDGTHGESLADAVVRDFRDLGPAIDRLTG